MSSMGDSKNAALDHLLLEWNTDFEIGVEIIDVQHREIFRAYNSVVASYHNLERVVASEALEFLSDYIELHFAEEERVMAALRYPNLEQHKISHQKLLSELETFRSDFEQKNTFLSFEIILFMRRWLINHILSEDTKIRNYAGRTSL